MGVRRPLNEILTKTDQLQKNKIILVDFMMQFRIENPYYKTEYLTSF